MTARIGILLSGSGTTYDNLVHAITDGRIDAEIVVVVGSRIGLGGLQLAADHGHPSCIAQLSDEVTAALTDATVDYVVMCGWLKYWDPPARWSQRTVNIHPSLLPSFGGKGFYGSRVHQAVLAAGCTVSGCTAHLVSGGYDTGPILAQRCVPVLPADDATSLQARVQAAERELYPLVVADLVAGRIRRCADGRLVCPSATSPATDSPC